MIFFELIRITILDLEPNPCFQTILIISKTYHRIFSCYTSKHRSGQELPFIFFEIHASNGSPVYLGQLSQEKVVQASGLQNDVKDRTIQMIIPDLHVKSQIKWILTTKLPKHTDTLAGTNEQKYLNGHKIGPSSLREFYVGFFFSSTFKA